ncbi:MAG: DUF2752 domain-containing protein [Prevotella sp.]|nr:DUF2752 domain-containing protein [Prevotella sp.]
MKKVAIGLLLVVVLAVLTLVDPAQSIWIPKCPVKLLTGLQCPGCGFQRAAHALMHGDVLGALRFNWFLLYAVPYLLVLIAERYFLRGKWQLKIRQWAEDNRVIWSYVVVYFVWFVVRNIYGI